MSRKRRSYSTDATGQFGCSQHRSPPRSGRSRRGGHTSNRTPSIKSGTAWRRIQAVRPNRAHGANSARRDTYIESPTTNLTGKKPDIDTGRQTKSRSWRDLFHVKLTYPSRATAPCGRHGGPRPSPQQSPRFASQKNGRPEATPNPSAASDSDNGSYSRSNPVLTCRPG